MVRKRSRTSRKYYDEDNDSDSDFALDDPPSQPAQKKYSLRQRKRRLFTEFEFDDDGEEIEPTRAPSDDDDFDVEREIEHSEADNSEYISKETYINHYEPENEEMPEDVDGLIDFEDMIRADIVVNKNRIDYDNIIQKTLIKVQPLEEAAIGPPVQKLKRGRKPKIRPEGEIDSSLLEPETEMHESDFEDKDDKDYNPEDDADEEPIDCAKLMQAELSESNVALTSHLPEIESNIEEDLGQDTLQERILSKLVDIKTDNISEVPIAPQVAEEKINENNLPEVPQINVNMVTNGETSPVHTNTIVSVDDNLSQTSKTQIVEIDDDDVVLVEDEKKCEVIVLDD